MFKNLYRMIIVLYFLEEKLIERPNINMGEWSTNIGHLYSVITSYIQIKGGKPEDNQLGSLIYSSIL